MIIEDIEGLMRAISLYMDITNVERTMYYSEIRGRIHEPLPLHIEKIKKVFEEQGLAVFFQKEEQEHVIKFGYMPKRTIKKRIWLHILLFVATIFTTLIAGSFYAGGNPLYNFLDIWLGVPFSFSIILILGSHELGHYFVCKKSGVEASLPYFIPAIPPIGTFGAVIKMGSVFPDRKTLIKIGVAGPLVGFLVAIPITLIGLSLSELIVIEDATGMVGLGSSLIFKFLVGLAVEIPEGYDVVLHPAAFAGWLGLFITSLNLLPLGQLDGGHIVYGLLGRKKRRYLAIVILPLLFFMGIKWWPGWIFWILLIVIIGMRHTPLIDEITPVDKKDIVLGILAGLILALTLIPAPFTWIK